MSIKPSNSQNIKVLFSGMNRAVDIGLAPDGQCMELINARIKDGSVQPINPPIAIAEGLEDVRKIYYHPKASKILVLHSDNVEALNEDYTTYETLSSDLGENVNDIAILGNVVCFLTDTTILYAIWKGDTYKYIGEIPDLPELQIEQIPNVETAMVDDSYGGYGYLNYDLKYMKISTSDISSLSDDDFKKTFLYNHVGFIDNAIDALNKEEYMENPCLLRYAFRTASGDYIKISQPILVESMSSVSLQIAPYDGNVQLSQAYPFYYYYTDKLYSFTFEDLEEDDEVDKSKTIYCAPRNDKNPNNYNDSVSTYIAIAFGTKLKFGFDDIALSYLEGLITGIDIFISPVRWWEKEEVRNNSLTFERYVPKTDIAKQVTNAYRFYRVAEFSLTGEETWRLEDWSIDNISVQEELTDESPLHAFSAATSYIYNSRLHLANITYSWYKGYPLFLDAVGCSDSHTYTISFQYVGTYETSSTIGYGYKYEKKSDVNGYAITSISSEYGLTAVKRKHNTCSGYLTPFLCYPDSMATVMSIYVENVTTDVAFPVAVPLKKHPYLDMAYYCQETSRLSVDETDEDLSTTLNDSAMYINAWSGTAVTRDSIPDEYNTDFSSDNTIKVSALNSPISFPSSQTYQPSTHAVIGLCSNVQALSQGQFGQHPLYVFAEDGIFALSVDSSGETVYSTSSPVSRDVCTNSNSITATDNGVAFASSRGLMLIAGVQTACISDAIDGWVPSCLDTSAIFTSIAEVAQMYVDTEDSDGNNTREYMLSVMRFKDYMAGATMGYNYKENELIVANSSYPYSYVYNIGSRAWSKIGFSVTNFTNHYPELYALSLISEGTDDTAATYGVYDMQNDYCTVTKMLLITRPLRFGADSHKRIFQLALRGVVKRALSDLYLRGEQVQFRDEELDIFSDVGMYLLGSNDAEHFYLLKKKESVEDLRDLITKTNKTKAYKYFVLCLAGGVRSDVALNYIDVLTNTSFDNRLR